MKALGAITFVILMMIFSAFVLTQLWGWFFVPFFGLPALTIWYAMGIVFTIRLIVPTATIKKFENITVDDYILTVIHPLLYWGLGYLVYLLV